ncbi:hypothetical protein PTKIN_Ptkin02bG0098000 [Pterospermum kingtungense]
MDPSTGWFYNGCNQCLKSLCPHGELFHCVEHGQQAPKLTFKLNMIIQEQTGQMELLAFAKTSASETIMSCFVSLNKVVLFFLLCHITRVKFS